jgi:hypothetical protein
MTATYPISVSIPKTGGTGGTPVIYNINAGSVSLDISNMVIQIPILKGSAKQALKSPSEVKIIDMKKITRKLSVKGNLVANSGQVAFETAREVVEKLDTVTCSVPGATNANCGNHSVSYRGRTYQGAILDFKLSDDAKYLQDTAFSSNKVSRTIPVSFSLLITTYT